MTTLNSASSPLGMSTSPRHTSPSDHCNSGPLRGFQRPRALWLPAMQTLSPKSTFLVTLNLTQERAAAPRRMPLQQLQLVSSRGGS